ncbi:MAG: hypothetical protein PHG97_05325 [Candidatus Margulisbacteria bacterium]|nr:hypothetical protein [Candidatus Margulisiibacteriota bacterium]
MEVNAAYAVDMPITTTVTSSTGGPTQLQSSIGGASIGYIKVGTAEVFTLAWHPDFKFGPWGLGADVNLSLGQQAAPANYENFVLRYAKYDDSRKGLQFGILDGVTVGRGLIMNNYTTRKGSTVMLNNEQTGVKGYVDLDKYVMHGMVTRSNIYMVRVEERVNPLLTLGQYYINDSTGRTIVQAGGAARSFPSVAAIGADAIMPLPANFQAYAEAGQIINHGNGLAAGLSWAYDLMVANASFSAEYRMLDKGFVPGYFGVDYENNPVDLASAEATNTPKNGYLAKLGINALGLASLTAVYESYNNSNSSLTADLTAKFTDQWNVRGYYKQPNFVDFRSISLEQGAVLGADVAYKVNQNMSLVTHYKKAYNPVTGQVESTQYYEIALGF